MSQGQKPGHFLVGAFGSIPPFHSALPFLLSVVLVCSAFQFFFSASLMPRAGFSEVKILIAGLFPRISAIPGLLLYRCSSRFGSRAPRETPDLVS